MYARTILVKIIVYFSLVTVLTAMTACSDGGEQPIKVTGQLVFNGDAAAPGSTARISMFEHRENGGEKRIVAERTLHELSGKPIGFEIDVARNLIDPAGTYGLRAQIVDSEGNVDWTTRETARIKPLEPQQPVALALTRLIDDSELTFLKYECGDGFHVLIGRTDDRALVRMGNRRLVLLAESRHKKHTTYSDDHDNRLVMQTDNTAAINIDGAQHDGCQATESGKSMPEPNNKPTSGGSPTDV